jgi:hypothetical protein
MQSAPRARIKGEASGCLASFGARIKPAQVNFVTLTIPVIQVQPPSF